MILTNRLNSYMNVLNDEICIFNISEFSAGIGISEGYGKKKEGYLGTLPTPL